MGEELFELTLPFVPSAAKNRTKIAVINGRRRIIGSDRARYHKKLIQELASIKRAGHRGPMFPDESVRVSMLLRDNATLNIRVSFIGEKPLDKAGRNRDLHNIDDVVLDALQGYAFTNDNQVCDLRLLRYKGNLLI